jgi:hypothetical protein
MASPQPLRRIREDKFAFAGGDSRFVLSSSLQLVARW